MFYRITARLPAGVFLLLSVLAGCVTTPQTQALLQTPEPSLPIRAELVEVPFFPQDVHQCGPASLAMALNAAGALVTPQALTPQVYLPDRQGSLQVEMLAATRRNGKLAYQLRPSLEDVLAEVANGTPVVILQNLALSWYPLWHYAVVVGYDLERSELILRSGLDQRLVMSLSTFEHTWRRGGYWAMLALPAGRAPHTAQEGPYVTAVLALEQTGQTLPAQQAYATLLRHWPGNLTARIGLGNTSHALKDLQGAEAAFRQASQDHPESAVAFNNLAQTLSDEGRLTEALEAARHAVSLGGAHEASSQETLNDILRKQQ